MSLVEQLQSDASGPGMDARGSTHQFNPADAASTATVVPDDSKIVPVVEDGSPFSTEDEFRSSALLSDADDKNKKNQEQQQHQQQEPQQQQQQQQQQQHQEEETMPHEPQQQHAGERRRSTGGNSGSGSAGGISRESSEVDVDTAALTSHIEINKIHNDLLATLTQLCQDNIAEPQRSVKISERLRVVSSTMAPDQSTVRTLADDVARALLVSSSSSIASLVADATITIAPPPPPPPPPSSSSSPLHVPHAPTTPKDSATASSVSPSRPSPSPPSSPPGGGDDESKTSPKTGAQLRSAAMSVSPSTSASPSAAAQPPQSTSTSTSLLEISSMSQLTTMSSAAHTQAHPNPNLHVTPGKVVSSLVEVILNSTKKMMKLDQLMLQQQQEHKRQREQRRHRQQRLCTSRTPPRRRNNISDGDDDGDDAGHRDNRAASPLFGRRRSHAPPNADLAAVLSMVSGVFHAAIGPDADATAAGAAAGDLPPSESQQSLSNAKAPSLSMALQQSQSASMAALSTQVSHAMFNDNSRMLSIDLRAPFQREGSGGGIINNNSSSKGGCVAPPMVTASPATPLQSELNPAALAAHNAAHHQLQIDGGGGDAQRPGALDPPTLRLPRRESVMSDIGPGAKHQRSVEEGEDDVGMHMINGYLVLSELGKGAQAPVVLAVDTETNVEHAIKIVPRPTINPAASSSLQRQKKQQIHLMSQEIKAMKRCRHKNLVRLHEVIDDERSASLFLVMEFLQQGVTAAALSDGAMDRRYAAIRVIHFGRRLCAALQYLHERNIVHRDIKPENILLRDDGEPCLADFGVCDCLDAAADNRGRLPQIKRTGVPGATASAPMSTMKRANSAIVEPTSRRESTLLLEAGGTGGGSRKASLLAPPPPQLARTQTSDVSSSAAAATATPLADLRKQSKDSSESKSAAVAAAGAIDGGGSAAAGAGPIRGTIAFLAPELIDGNTTGASAKATAFAGDCFGLGLSLYCLLYGCLPFATTDAREYIRRIKTEDVPFPPQHPAWTGCDFARVAECDLGRPDREMDPSPELIDLLKKMLHRDPLERIGVDEAREIFKSLDAEGEFALSPASFGSSMSGDGFGDGAGAAASFNLDLRTSSM